MQELVMGERKSIDQLHWDEVHNWTVVLTMLLNGDDAREHFGIKPRRGRPTDEMRKRDIAYQYWSLRAAGELDVVARTIVAASCGLSESRVYQLALRWTIFKMPEPHASTPEEALLLRLQTELAARLERRARSSK